MSYPHPYVIDSDNELELINPTIDEVFGGMTSTLDKIKSCTLKSATDIYGKKNLNVIGQHIHNFRPQIALSYIKEALQEINEIKLLGEKVVGNVKKELSGEFDGEKMVVIDDEPDVTEEWLKITAKLFIDDLIKKSEAELTRLRSIIIERVASLSDGCAPESDEENIPNKNAKAVIGKSSKASSERLSFKYSHLNESQGKITGLRKALIEYGLIDPGISLPDFRKVFSSSKIEAPIKWTGDISELAYLIKLIHTKYKKVDRTALWKTADLCFVQPTGEPFGSNKLRWQQRPKKSAPMLERLAKNL